MPLRNRAWAGRAAGTRCGGRLRAQRAGVSARTPRPPLATLPQRSAPPRGPLLARRGGCAHPLRPPPPSAAPAPRRARPPARPPASPKKPRIHPPAKIRPGSMRQIRQVGKPVIPLTRAAWGSLRSRPILSVKKRHTFGYREPRGLPFHPARRKLSIVVKSARCL